jgi:hypothetical protein
MGYKSIFILIANPGDPTPWIYGRNIHLSIMRAVDVPSVARNRLDGTLRPFVTSQQAAASRSMYTALN